MNNSLQAYIDLTRLHFFFAWPLLFCSGFLLAAASYGTFSFLSLVRAVFIGLLGFSAGLVLNDYVDRDYDRKDIEAERLTKYWRLFGKRPIPAGLIAPERALALFLILVITTSLLIATLPSPNSLFVFIIMVFSYGIEVFYQIRKRDQRFPVAQLLGRTDFALFPVAGYLCLGTPDLTALLYFLFFYPFAIAHLGVNDLIDIANDQVRGMKTIPILYGINATAFWVAGFLFIHGITALPFLSRLGWIARIGILNGLILLALAGVVILREKTADAGLKVLPLFHVAMLIYAVSIILDAVM
jgi:4-hydroxybenzoate polyprenyltransferase